MEEHRKWLETLLLDAEEFELIAKLAKLLPVTRMAEQMSPEAVAGLLREFHERMTRQIFACGGTVDKYIGDEILAVFGLPDVTPNDPANALLCAVGMTSAINAWNMERQGQGEPPLRIGIGLN